MRLSRIAVAAVSFLLIASLLGGCSAKSNQENDSQENHQSLARVEIYTGDEETLLKTIEDKDLLKQFNEKIALDDWLDMDTKDLSSSTESKKSSESDSAAVPEYFFVLYKPAVAKISDGSPERILEITTFQDSNVVKMQIPSQVIKNLPVPEDYLTFHPQLPEKTLSYLRSLVS